MIGGSQPAGSRIVDYLDTIPAPKLVSRWRVIQERTGRGWLYTTRLHVTLALNGDGIEESELARRPLI